MWSALDLSCWTSFSMESGFLHPEGVFPVSAKSIMIKLEHIDIFADNVVYYVID